MLKLEASFQECDPRPLCIRSHARVPQPERGHEGPENENDSHHSESHLSDRLPAIRQSRRRLWSRLREQVWSAERASVSASRMRRTSRNHICPTPATGRAQGDQQPPPRCARAGRAGGASDARAGRAGGEWMLARCSLKWMLARCSCYWTQSDMLPDMAGHPKQRDTHGSGCYGVPGGAGRASSRSSAFPQLPHELVDGGSIVTVTASTCGTGGGEGGFAPPLP